MPYSDPAATSNPTAGQPILAAWGDIVRDDLEYLARNFPHCSIKETTAQSVPSGAWTALNSNEENSDIGGMHSTSVNTHRITVPASEGGLYTATCLAGFAAAASGGRYVGFAISGGTPITANAQLGSASIALTLGGATSFVLAAGDYVSCVVFQDSGGNLNCTLNDFTLMWRAAA